MCRYMHMYMYIYTHISPDDLKQIQSDLIRAFAFLLFSTLAGTLYIFSSGILTVDLIAFSPQKLPFLKFSCFYFSLFALGILSGISEFYLFKIKSEAMYIRIL